MILWLLKKRSVRVVQSKVESMTVFNTEEVDIKKQPMFFGKPLGVQRYDTYKKDVDEIVPNKLNYD